MADGACDYGEEPHGRNWILTHLDPPMSLELCDEHLAPGLIGLLAGDLGVDFTRFYQAVERFIAKEARQAEKDLAAAVAAEGQQASDHGPDSPEDQPLPRPPAGMAYTNDGVLVPDDEGGEL